MDLHVLACSNNNKHITKPLDLDSPNSPPATETTSGLEVPGRSSEVCTRAGRVYARSLDWAIPEMFAGGSKRQASIIKETAGPDSEERAIPELFAEVSRRRVSSSLGSWQVYWPV